MLLIDNHRRVKEKSGPPVGDDGSSALAAHVIKEAIQNGVESGRSKEYIVATVHAFLEGKLSLHDFVIQTSRLEPDPNTDLPFPVSKRPLINSPEPCKSVSGRFCPLGCGTSNRTSH